MLAYDELAESYAKAKEQLLAYHDLHGQLEASEAKMQRLLNNLPGAVYRCGLDAALNRTLEFVSKGCMDLLGCSPEELIIQNSNMIERITAAQDIERTDIAMRKAILEREPYKFVYRIQFDDGEVKWIRDQGEAVYDEHGVPVALEGIMIDVSDQKFKEIKLDGENKKLRSSIGDQYRFGDIVGKSDAMQDVYQFIIRASECDTNVIVYGETGTGKDLVAHTVHNLSGRKGKYISVNCGAIPEQLMESEFFGYKKGAFSGATADRVGYLTAANNGTLFLDEIGELPINMQVKLLRALETKEFTPVGGSIPQQSSFRIVAATNRDLKEMVRKGTMRADFFYRIHVLPVTIPPLRKRREDIPLLIDEFVSAHFKDEEPPSIPPQVRIAFEDYDWPGNVREMQNVLDRYLTFGELDFSDIRISGTAPAPAMGSIAFEEEELLKDSVEKLERAIIVRTLEAKRWRKSETAATLGLNIRTLQRKIKRYKI
ncbi:MAG: sigma 54-interacting transcriptional regulator [Desulfovibrionales bacterium]|nr:sigma 54-interacting transcriptional regulator [Desulfovibrionales bacterium]